MKKFTAFLSALILSAMCAIPFSSCAKKDNGKLPVYLILGQSNASGNGKIKDLPARYLNKEYGGVTIYCDGSANGAVRGSLTKVGTVSGQGSVSTDRFGVEIGLAEYFTEKNVEAGLIKCGFDGSSINLTNTAYGTWWTDIQDIPLNVIKCYDRFKTALVNALDAYKSEGYDVEIKGVIWLQGESNAGNASYADDLDKLIQRLRADLSEPALYFVAGTISYVGEGKYQSDCAVNLAVRALEEKQNCGYVESGRYSTDPNDPYHWTGENFVKIGREFAEKLYNKTLR